jgi:hypothetical protein
VTATSIVVPERYAPFTVGDVRFETTGINVSTVAVTAELAVLRFPTASLKTSPVTEIDIDMVELVAGVNVNVYEVPEPANPLIAPPTTETSALVKLTLDSLNVAVTVAVWPAINDVRELDN